MTQLNDSFDLLARTARDHLNTGAGLNFVIQPESAPFIPADVLMGFTGIIDFKSGKRIVMTGATADWLQVDLVNETAVFSAGPPPRPFPSNEVWCEVSGINGHLRCW